MHLDIFQIGSLPRLCGSLFVLAFAVFFIGGMMFWGRMGGMPSWAASFANTYVTCERIFVIAAVILTIAGMMLLAEIFKSLGTGYWGPLGAYGYVVAAIFILTAEVLGLTSGTTPYPLVILYVLLAFLAQALMGAALIPAGILPGWVGWFTILWNIAWMLILPIFSPRDIYFPAVHHVAPLCIGILFLIRYPG